jgi:hypothetical protein
VHRPLQIAAGSQHHEIAAWMSGEQGPLAQTGHSAKLDARMHMCNANRHDRLMMAMALAIEQAGTTL